MVPAIENGTIPIVRVGEIGNREINFAILRSFGILRYIRLN